MNAGISAIAVGFALNDGPIADAPVPLVGIPLSGVPGFIGQEFVSMVPTLGDECVYTLLGDLVTPEATSAIATANDPIDVDTFSIRVADAEVIPLPGAGLFLIGGVGALAMVHRRRDQPLHR